MADLNSIELDPEAQSLFEQLGGTESWKQTRPDLMVAERLAQTLLEEQQRFDAVRITLVEWVYLISRYLVSDTYARTSDGETKAFGVLEKKLTKLAAAPGHLGAMMVRFRGAPPNAELPEKYDYEVVIGNTAVDLHMAPVLARRSGGRYAKLPDRLLDAFTVLADYGVNNIYMRLSPAGGQNAASLRAALKILCGFRKARQTSAPIAIEYEQFQRTVPVINDENFFPDPNLTVLAGINGLSVQAMENLVFKVDNWLRRQKDTSAEKKYAGVYNAAIELPKLKAQVKTPPVELNNVKWLISDSDAEAVSAEKTYIAQLAMDMAGASPQQVAKMIKSVYGDDYAKINSAMLGERLHLSSHLLNAAEQRANHADIEKEVLGNLQMRLDQVKDHVIDEMNVREDTEAATRRPDQAVPPDVVHEQIYRMVQFFKGRSVTRKKMVGLVHRAIEFTPRDFEILASDFKISDQAAHALVDRLKGCFTEEGRFKKSAFHDAIGDFQQYESKIFSFLWHHMKDAILSEDRVPFLNALQTLTARMNQPKRAFKVLIEDICGDPENVQFSDNKAVMLASLIVHRPDKSLADYEITPEDIVLNRHNLDDMMVQYAAWRIEKLREAFFAKLNTIHHKLSEALTLGHTNEKHIPAAVMINLERELYIFLSLVECDSGKAILRSAVREYGDPNAEIYQLKKSQEFMSGLLQNLRVVLRGLGTIGSMNDMAILEQVRMQDETFQRLKKDPKHRAQAGRITEWVDEAIKIIKFRA